ncbi:glycosyl hydrolase family 88 [Pseudoduganella lutea]|uniref:Glycosyl hydrolase family 88 n=2 Tax=Pseudoduganella lutea TaxID=321985 RepID=A0A4P6L7Q5_9BURK|nr:glycosyl hydrolase family 88 [Pseudoduganella lutea]
MLLALQAPAATAATSAQPTLAPDAVLALAERAADYQLASMAAGWVPANAAYETPDRKGWVQGAFFVGLTDLAARSSRPIYRQTILLRGIANEWKLDERLYHADDQVIGQSYIWAAANGAGPEALAPSRKALDQILEKRPRVPLGFFTEAGVDCQTRWCWCDALFMAPPLWAQMSRATGDTRYASFAKEELKVTTDYLFDPKEHLYYRDSRFFDRRGPDGEKIFWSRGNGWVFAGLARTLEALPKTDPGRGAIETTFRQMAARLRGIQKPDGYWSPSLLGNPAKSLPESSGTAFYTYGFAWGIRNGLLDRAGYEPVVRRGWRALTASVHPSGKVGHVQPIGDSPDNVTHDDTQYYGVGAFLMAATAVADLKLDASNQPSKATSK